MVKGHVPCQICYPWVETVFRLSDPPVGFRDEIYLCLSLDDWALDPMLRVEVDVEGGENSLPFLQNTYELHRMVPSGKAISFCFAVVPNEFPGKTPEYFTLEHLPTLDLLNLKASDRGVFVRGNPPLARLNYGVGSGDVGVVGTGRAMRHESLRAIAGHSRTFNPATSGLSSGLSHVIDKQFGNGISGVDDEGKADFSKAAPRLNELVPPLHMPVDALAFYGGVEDVRRTILYSGIDDDDARSHDSKTNAIPSHAAPPNECMQWIVSPSTSVFRCRSYGGQRPPIYFDSADVLDAAFEADWLRFTKGGFLDGVGIKGMPLMGMFQQSSMLDDVRRLLRAKYPSLMIAFKYYSSRSATEENLDVGGTAVTLPGFKAFCRDALIGDDKFPPEFIERTWNGASPVVSARAPVVPIASDGLAGRAMGQIGQPPKEAKEEPLERFEFCIQALVLIAKAKFLDPMRAPSIRDALKKLLSEHVSIAARLERTDGNVGYSDGDAFRRENLYVEDIDHVFARHQVSLRSLFESHARRSHCFSTETPVQVGGESEEARALTVSSFRALLNRCLLEYVAPSMLSNQDLVLIFRTSKLTVIDELAVSVDRKATCEMTFDDFLEALARLSAISGCSFADMINELSMQAPPGTATRAVSPLKRRSLKREASGTTGQTKEMPGQLAE